MDEEEANLPMPGGSFDESLKGQPFRAGLGNKEAFLRSDLVKKIISKYYSTFEFIKKSNFKSFILKRPIYTSALAFIGLFVIGTSLGILTERKPSENNDLNDISIAEVVKEEDDKIKDDSSNKIFNDKEILAANLSIPLTTSSPTDQEIKFLIESWLKGKADLLKGLESEILSSVASPNLYNIEIERRKKYNNLGQNIIINARITSIEVIKKTNKRIEADVEMKYEDKKISSSGDIIESSVYPSLKVKYIIGKNKNNWQLVDYISGN